MYLLRSISMHPIHHIFTLLRFHDRPIPCSLYFYASTACTGRIMFCLVRCGFCLVFSHVFRPSRAKYIYFASQECWTDFDKICGR